MILLVFCLKLSIDILRIYVYNIYRGVFIMIFRATLEGKVIDKKEGKKGDYLVVYTNGDIVRVFGDVATYGVGDDFIADVEIITKDYFCRVRVD